MLGQDNHATANLRNALVNILVQTGREYDAVALKRTVADNDGMDALKEEICAKESNVRCSG